MIKQIKHLINCNIMKNNFYYSRIISISALLFISLFVTKCSTQIKLNNQSGKIDISEFESGAHHWYDIKDKDKIIEPLENQKKYLPYEYENIADNILLYQKSNGGWAKNYDMLAVLTEEQKSKVIKSKSFYNTCFDNGATYSQLNYLAQVIALTNNHKFKTAFVEGVKFVLSAQYPNGGWPQFFPDTSGYRKYITFNDGAMIGVMKLLQRIVNRESGYGLNDSDLYDKVLYTFNKGIDCILNTQIKESDSLLVWCQQHNNINLKPENARTFEPAAICNGESSAIVEFLMSLPNPNKKLVHSVQSAVNWFRSSRIYGIRVKTIPAPKTEYIYRTSDSDIIIIADKNSKPIWARYYQLITHRPMFCNRDGKIVYSLEEVERERRIGYAWYVYDPQNVLDKYSAWFKKVNAN